MHGKALRPGLKPLALATVLTLGGAYVLAFFYAPNDADQGFVQKIFYLHVPLAICALGGFIAGGVMAIGYLRTGEQRWDLRSYVAIHLSLIFAVATLITGSIWARASWGHWWVWQEPTLVSFLIIFLLYACYQPMRFAIEDPERQARYAAVFAVVAGAFVPLNFLAVRLANPLVHPRLLGSTGSLPPSMELTFVIAMVGMALLWVTLWKYEITAKQTSMQLRALKRRLAERAEMTLPAPAPRRSSAPRPTPAARPAEPVEL